MKKRILVVDDEPLLREVLRDFLEVAGFEVSEAENGQVAFEKVCSEAFDCVISDVRMPHGSGVELVKNIHSITSLAKLPLVLMTGYSDVTFEELQKYGVLMMLGKPFDPEVIVEEVRKIFQKVA